jgi:hypothetical protein
MIFSPAFHLCDVALEFERRLKMLEIDFAAFVSVHDLLLELDDLGDLRPDEVRVEVLLLNQFFGVGLKSSEKNK